MKNLLLLTLSVLLLQCKNAPNPPEQTDKPEVAEVVVADEKEGEQETTQVAETPPPPDFDTTQWEEVVFRV